MLFIRKNEPLSQNPKTEKTMVRPWLVQNLLICQGFGNEKAPLLLYNKS